MKINFVVCMSQLNQKIYRIAFLEYFVRTSLFYATIGQTIKFNAFVKRNSSRNKANFVIARHRNE